MTSQTQIESDSSLLEDTDHDVIYTLRTAHQNQTQHIILADQKANVLIGIVAVIISILISRGDFLSSEDMRLQLAFGVFIVCEITALFLALMVITPKTTGGRRVKEVEELPNPLFFGFFSSLKQEEYLDFLRKNLVNSAQAREFIARDLFQIGLVLGRKYRMLKLAYILTFIGFFILIVSLTLLQIFKF